VSDVVVDTSTWIEFLAGRPAPELEAALAAGAVTLPPIVVAELVSGARSARDRRSLLGLLRDLPVHGTPFEHWVRVGELRRRLRSKGESISTPDAHVAQCALDRDALLLSRDAVFDRIARMEPLRVRPG
jgi:hypothetical protein